MTAYPLLTERLEIAPLAASDLDAFVAYRREPDVARWQPWSVDYDTDDADRLLVDQPTGDLPEPGAWLQLAVREWTSGALLGDVAVHTLDDQPDSYEIGVTFARASQGRGYATEAVTRVLDHLMQDVGAHRVIAICDARNEPVARLFRRLDFRHEARQVEADYFKGAWTTLDTYALLQREYLARR